MIGGRRDSDVPLGPLKMLYGVLILLSPMIVIYAVAGAICLFEAVRR